MLSIFLRAAITILCILLNIRSLLKIFRSRKITKKILNDGEIGLLSLPEGCIADVISQTTPSHACQLSIVSKLFKSAAESDAVWNKFLPSDIYEFIARSTNPLSIADFPSIKQLYLHLSDHHLIIDGGNKSFSLEKRSGKKCFMLAARTLKIAWGDTPQYWTWTSLPDARFELVAELRLVWWLEIFGNIDTSLLSPDTNYAAYLVYKLTPDAYGFELTNGRYPYSRTLPAEVSVRLFGEHKIHYAVLEHRYKTEKKNEANIRYPSERKDGWLEVELGEFFNKRGANEEVEMGLMEVKAGTTKGGLIVLGIEIRPKEGY